MVLRLLRAGGGHAKRLARQTALAKETVFRQDGNDGFFAALGYNRELHLAALDVEHRIRRVPLRKDKFIRLVLPAGFSSRSFVRKRRGSNVAAVPVTHQPLPDSVPLAGCRQAGATEHARSRRSVRALFFVERRCWVRAMRNLPPRRLQAIRKSPIRRIIRPRSAVLRTELSSTEHYCSDGFIRPANVRSTSCAANATEAEMRRRGRRKRRKP